MQIVALMYKSRRYVFRENVHFAVGNGFPWTLSAINHDCMDIALVLVLVLIFVVLLTSLRILRAKFSEVGLTHDPSAALMYPPQHGRMQYWIQAGQRAAACLIRAPSGTTPETQSAHPPRRTYNVHVGLQLEFD